MPLIFKRTVEPALEPVSVADFKAWQRVDGTDQDTVIARLLSQARGEAEEYMKRQLITATYVLTQDSFAPLYQPLFTNPDNFVNVPAAYYQNSTVWQTELLLPRPRLQSVTSVVYIDTTGAEQVLDPSNYQVSLSEPGRIAPAYGKAWPATRAQYNAVTVTYVAGYGDSPASVPAQIQQFITAYAGFYYEHRDDGQDVPQSLYGMLDTFRITKMDW